MKQIGAECIACCAAISYQGGLEHVCYFDKSVNKEKFAQFLEELRAKNKDRRFAIYMDQLSVHICKYTKERLAKLSIPYVIGPLALPDANPIERGFNIAKGAYKKLKLQAMLHGEEHTSLSLIKRAFDKLTKVQI